MGQQFGLILICLVCALAGAVFILFQQLKSAKLIAQNMEGKANELIQKYSSLISIEDEKLVLLKEKGSLELQTNELRAAYKEKRVIFDNLVREAAIYNEEIEIAEWGFYKPHFDFDTSEKFKLALEENRKKQKNLLDVELAHMKSRGISTKDLKLPDYAFNRACDSAISNVRWNNAAKMEERINKAFNFINKNSSGIHITNSVLKLKLDELRLTHEYELKKQEEKEEQAAIRQKIRDDEKLEVELNKAILAEEKFQKLLDKAEREAKSAVGEKQQELEMKVAALTKELAEAREKSERAKSMAEQTKAGHIYVISNKGSFGEDVYKVGMTRRLEPQDRVDELGDASVPFVFDVHAMIYTEDAPALEKGLHKAMEPYRLNLVNNRKEFFKIGLFEIQKIVKEKFKDVEFILIAEAREYNETLSIRAMRDEKLLEADVRASFPEAI